MPPQVSSEMPVRPYDSLDLIQLLKASTTRISYMSLRLRYEIATIVLQPTSLCNLKCKYCYLPDIDKNLKMLPQVAEHVAEQVETSGQQHIDILWHAGEPLTCGIKHFQKLLEPFRSLLERGRISHCIQTNGTLLNDEWCELLKANRFHIGVSIDGPQWANRNRVNKNGKEQYQKIVGGIEILKKNNLEFTAIAVIDENSLSNAKEIYQYFSQLGCKWVGINIEEQECANIRKVRDDQSVSDFWTDLYNEWKSNLNIEIREFTKIFRWFNLILTDNLSSVENTKYDLFPTVSYKGDFVFLSPEFLGGSSHKYRNFIVGNVLKDSLFDIAKKANDIDYVSEYNRGVLKCMKQCDYFALCKGGQASNKFYETGNLDTTETVYCRNSVIRPANATISQIKLQNEDVVFDVELEYDEGH